MAKIDFSKLDDTQKLALVNNRWDSSKELWEIIEDTYKQNTRIYENRAGWLENVIYRRKKWIVQANRIFVNMEAVINSIIANPPGINLLPGREGQEAQDFASKMENYLRKKYLDRNVKETMRMGLRNLYFSRLLCIKAFWNPSIDDFDFRAVDPRKVRVAKYARKIQDSEFAIEDIDDNLCAVMERFPGKKAELLKKYGFAEGEAGEKDAYIKNPDVTYKEAWVQDHIIFKLDTIILDTIENPYWDWDGILITKEEEEELKNADVPRRRTILSAAKQDQAVRAQAMAAQMQPPAPAMDAAMAPVEQQEGETSPQETPENAAMGEPDDSGAVSETPAEPIDPKYRPYFFNYFDQPRKPYIIATIFNNENKPIGRTDMITLASSLQRGIDKRKMDIDENCELVNGIIKVDAGTMGKSDAQRLAYETKGIVWGKGVKDGVTRETGQALPQMVFDDMNDSRAEIDNIMAASSAFRGEREGQETKAGRLALIQQSFLRLNELIQMTDDVYKQIFEWGMQFVKCRYTEYHYAKWMGQDNAREMIEIIQDDVETGSEVTVIAGKTLPVDDEFKFEQAQNDFEKGALGLTDYLRIAKYEDPKETAKNAVKWQMNKPVAVGMSEEEMQKVAPQEKEEKPPSVSIAYKDLPPDAQKQLLAQIGIESDEEILVAEKIMEHKKNAPQPPKEEKIPKAE